jgi:hypothetical protein
MVIAAPGPLHTPPSSSSPPETPIQTTLVYLLYHTHAHTHLLVLVQCPSIRTILLTVIQAPPHCPFHGGILVGIAFTFYSYTFFFIFFLYIYMAGAPTLSLPHGDIGRDCIYRQQGNEILPLGEYFSYFFYCNFSIIIINYHL